MPKGRLYFASTATTYVMVLCKVCAAQSNEKLIEQPIGVEVMCFTETRRFPRNLADFCSLISLKVNEKDYPPRLETFELTVISQFVFSPPIRPVRLAITAASSAGSTGLATWC